MDPILEGAHGDFPGGCQERIAALEAENTRLKVALERYGFHVKSCPAHLQPFNDTPCECGWAEHPDRAALKGAE